MNQPAIFLVFTVLAVGSSLAAYHDVFKTKNLDWLLLPTNWDKNVRDTLQALRWLECDTTEEPYAILMCLARASRDTNLSLYERTVYLDLISISDPNEECTEQQTYRAMEISALLDKYPFRLGKGFAQLLYNDGQYKFGMYSESIMDDFLKGCPYNHEAEKDLDKVIAATQDEEDYNDDKILTILKDLENFLFDVRLTIRIAKKIGISHFYSFMSMCCKKLRHGREYKMTVVSLAATFGYTFRHSRQKISKLVEYNGLCAVLNRDKNKIMEILKRNHNMLSSEAGPSYSID